MCTHPMRLTWGTLCSFLDYIFIVPWCHFISFESQNSFYSSIICECYIDILLLLSNKCSLLIFCIVLNVFLPQHMLIFSILILNLNLLHWVLATKLIYFIFQSSFHAKSHKCLSFVWDTITQKECEQGRNWENLRECEREGNN